LHAPLDFSIVLLGVPGRTIPLVVASDPARIRVLLEVEPLREVPSAIGDGFRGAGDALLVLLENDLLLRGLGTFDKFSI